VSKSFGIPLFSTRTELKRLVKEFLKAGDFLKAIAYLNLDADGRRVDAHIEEMKKRWVKFKDARIKLVAQINKQLARIGKAT
jgi:hypothetical protein